MFLSNSYDNNSRFKSIFSFLFINLSKSLFLFLIISIYIGIELVLTKNTFNILRFYIFK